MTGTGMIPGGVIYIIPLYLIQFRDAVWVIILFIAKIDIKEARYI
jgi:hypothetical protein